MLQTTVSCLKSSVSLFVYRPVKKLRSAPLKLSTGSEKPHAVMKNGQQRAVQGNNSKSLICTRKVGELVEIFGKPTDWLSLLTQLNYISYWQYLYLMISETDDWTMISFSNNQKYESAVESPDLDLLSGFLSLLLSLPFLHSFTTDCGLREYCFHMLLLD